MFFDKNIGAWYRDKGVPFSSKPEAKKAVEEIRSKRPNTALTVSWRKEENGSTTAGYVIVKLR